jgi:hypothetical protein
LISSDNHPPLISADTRLSLTAIFSSLSVAISAHAKEPVDQFQQIQSMQSQMNNKITGLWKESKVKKKSFAVA